MNTTSVSFFSTEENQAILRRFILSLSDTPAILPPAPNVLPSLKIFFNIVIANTNQFDQYCTTNIEWIGQQFISDLIDFSAATAEQKSSSLPKIFTMAYRFLCELDISLQSDLSFELQKIKNFVDQNLEKFSDSERQQLIYAHYTMPVQIIKKLIHSPALLEYKAFTDTARYASELKDTWDKEIKAKSEEIEALREGLGRITTKYNFVGLMKGFERLNIIKEKERHRSFALLILLGFIMMAPVATHLWFTMNHIDTIEEHRSTLIYSLPVLIALEMILPRSTKPTTNIS